MKATNNTTMAGGDQDGDHLAYLQRFWGAHASHFMRWFLAIPYAGQVLLIRNACPDIPVQYDVKEPRPQASQLLTPELSLKALLEENGKVFLRLMNARARRSDDCLRQDLHYLRAMHAEGRMPIFSGEAFKHVSLAFIDPNDPEQNVQSLLPSASKASIDEKRKLIAEGRLIEADVWLALQMRQQVILTVLTNVAHTFEAMFLQQAMMEGTVSEATIGCRFCGAITRSDANASESANTSLLRCACEAAYYCCKAHQVEDWKNHKASCKEIRKLKAEKQAQECTNDA